MASPHVAGLAAYVMSLDNLRGDVPVQDDKNGDGFEDSGDDVVDLVTKRIIELAESTGAEVKGNVKGTTGRIAYNGAQELTGKRNAGGRGSTGRNQ